MNPDVTEQPVDLIRQAWEELRSHCFARCGADFLWTAACEAEYYVLALHLVGTPGFAYEIAGSAVILSAYGARHVLPFSRLSAQSLEHLRVGLATDQAASLEKLRRLVHKRYELDAVPTVIGQVEKLH